MPDKDLEMRRIGQRVDQLTGEIYTREAYDPDKPPKLVRTVCFTILNKATIAYENLLRNKDMLGREVAC